LQRYIISSFFFYKQMSKEVLILTIFGIAIIAALLSTTTISVYDGILSLPLPVANVWALDINGTGEADTLTGTMQKDVIRGRGGDDMISALEGNDQIRGDAGVDTIHGDNGRDRIRGDRGNDVMFGDAGNDILIAGPGDDSLTGGPGKDTFNCGEGIDMAIDFNPAEDDDMPVECENISPPPPTTTTTDSDITTPAESFEVDDTTENSFDSPLDEGDVEDDGDGG
jgi:Ca2+-binding RTX toxin-like protein